MSTNSEEASSGEQWETPVTILNSLSFEREEVVTLREKFANGARAEKGQRISVQKEESGVRALVKLPSCGGITLYPEVDGTLVQERTSFVKKEQNYYRMENDKVSVLLNGRGEIISYVRKESGREFAAAPMNALHLYKDIPRHFDAWDLDSVYRELETDEAKVQQVETLAQGIEAVVKITGKIGNSEFLQVLRLATGAQLLEVEMKIDWQELHRLLKVSFPTTVYAQNGINEIQFGYVERPAHRSRQYDKDRFEVCNHRYSAMYDNGSGFALFNDCKYGISMEEGCLSLTLLRAAASPAMRTDNGLQSFRYGFYPWEGNKMEHGIAARAYGFNVKPQIQKGRLDIGSVLFCDKKNILLDTMKLAEDGSSDMILRFYEAENAATAAVIQGPVLEGEKIYLCNMLENTQQEISEKAGEIRLNFTPFEIKTI